MEARPKEGEEGIRLAVLTTMGEGREALLQHF